jgi:vancomycin resistance protein YoaR
VNYTRGFVDAGAIVDGEHVDVLGGGLSQMATTMYNAAYWSGVDLVQYKAHSEWFSRYPAGRESTIFLPNLDMKWKNDTPYPIVINSYVHNAKIHVDFWSTHYYDVEASRSTDPPARWGLGCAKPSFSITDYRKVSVNGAVVKDESRRWTYKSVDFCDEGE